MHRHLASRITAAVAGVLALASAPRAAVAAAAAAARDHHERVRGERPRAGDVDPVRDLLDGVPPGGCDAARPVPMVMHGHGWGGSRLARAGGGRRPAAMPASGSSRSTSAAGARAAASRT